MNVKPSAATIMDQALEKAEACCWKAPLFPAIRKCLTDSTEASNDAVRHGHNAWDQLESVTTNLMSVFRLVDQPGAEDLKAAFKEAKVLTRDRVVWQAIGRFRDLLDMMLSIRYLSDFAKGDENKVSQLRHAFLKIHSDMLMQLMGRHDSWGAFLRHLWQNTDDDDVKLALSRMTPDQFKKNGLDIDSDLMELPHIVLEAMSKTKTIINLADHVNDGRIGPPSDIASLRHSLQKLGKVLSYPQFLDPVQQSFDWCMRSSLLAVQHAVGAWAYLQQQACTTSIWKKDDSSRQPQIPKAGAHGSTRDHSDRLRLPREWRPC